MSDFARELATFEEAVRKASEGLYVLKLYITGTSTLSARAITNIRDICDQYLPGRYDLEVIDVRQQPELAVQRQLLAAPTLIKEMPTPLRRLVGDLSDTERVLSSLNIRR